MDRETSPRRRRRRLGRPIREKTPDSSYTDNGRALDDVDFEMLDYDAADVQNVSMQIRQPSSSRSAHESKILRRRDKNFSSLAARSHSQPRQAERLSSPEANELLKTVKRSLSSPRQKDGGVSESDISTEPYYNTRNKAVQEGRSRLEENLRRFEEERKRFEAEKRQFERERQEHKLRSKQLYDSEERRKFLQTYHYIKPKDVEDRRRLVHSLRLQRNEVPFVARRQAACSTCAESSTQLSSSEAEDGGQYFVKNLSPQRKSEGNVVAKVRGPPPPPPVVPARRSVSRNNSLSPIRPERRSKTPERRADIMRRSIVESSDVTDGVETQTVLKNAEEVQHETAAVLRQRKQEDTPKPINEKLEEARQEEIESPKTVEAKQIQKPLGFFESLKLVIFRKSNKELPKTVEYKPIKKISSNFIKTIYKEMGHEWQCLKADYPKEVKIIYELRNKCICHYIFLILFCGFGGLMFRYTEGSAENVFKCEIRKVKRDFIENLWTVSHNMR